MGNMNTAFQEPITVIVTRRIKPGFEQEFEAWLAGVVAEALRFPGHQGVNVIRPASASQPEYTLIFRFDRIDNLRRWEESDTRREWLGRVEALTVGEVSLHKVSGLEFWFTPSAGALIPPRWKMAVVTCLAIYPLINLLRLVLAPYTATLSPWISSALTLPLSITLMTWLIMPWMTRLFAWWLYPKPAKSNQSKT
jgi:uncharacterized protein